MAGDLRGEKKGKLIAYLWVFSLKLIAYLWMLSLKHFVFLLNFDLYVYNTSRGFGSRGGFDEPITSPRREFSRSMSSENWREAKLSGGSETREEQDDGEGDWRRAGPRERWSTYFFTTKIVKLDGSMHEHE